MKKLFLLLISVCLFAACSDSDDKPKQDYTSFVFYQTANVNLTNCVAGYKKDNKYYKIGELGDLSKGKYSPEIKMEDNSITEIYFFTDYNGCVRFDAIYNLTKYKKNILELLETTRGIKVTDKTDPAQYPQ